MVGRLSKTKTNDEFLKLITRLVRSAGSSRIRANGAT